jgi:2-methylcitrate dehydratase PrpD
VGDSSAAERIAEFALQLRYEDIPERVVAAAKVHVLDTLGCGLAAHALGVGVAGRSIAAHAASGSTVIGRAEPAVPTEAALANGMLCHALDFDDTHGRSICHIGVVMVPSALALAEARGRSGRELLAAVVAGNEVIARVGEAAAPEYMVRGFHPSSVCGIFGATIGAARMLELEHAEAVAALGIAGSMSSGIFAYLDDGTQTKPINTGWAATGGVHAALLAAAGGEGPRTVFEGRFGVFAAYYGGQHPILADRLSDLGEIWETERTAFKAYPACHFIHGCLDAAAAVREETHWSAEEIESVTVSVPDAAVPLVLEPLALKQRPQSAYDAKFSVPYSVAAMLAHGRVDVSSYRPESLGDPEVAALATRISYERRAFESYPRAFPGWIRIEGPDGATLERETPYQRGAPENPLTEDEVLSKFRTNASLALDAEAVEAVEAAILSLEELHDVGACMAPLARQPLRKVPA